ncbi:MAG: c-type cytochrome domain-containing protein, partial [Gemmataceae bacterium]
MTRLLLAGCTFLIALPLRAAEPDFSFFETRIRPVLVERCYECHGEKKQKGGLRLDSKAALLKGGDSGPAVVPGNPDDSLLMRALRHETVKMPPDARLPDAVLADFATWIG